MLGGIARRAANRILLELGRSDTSPHRDRLGPYAFQLELQALGRDIFQEPNISWQDWSPIHTLGNLLIRKYFAQFRRVDHSESDAGASNLVTLTYFIPYDHRYYIDARVVIMHDFDPVYSAILIADVRRYTEHREALDKRNFTWYLKAAIQKRRVYETA